MDVCLSKWQGTKKGIVSLFSGDAFFSRRVALKERDEDEQDDDDDDEGKYKTNKN